MKRILFFAVVVGLFASCVPDPEFNDYTKEFDYVWQTLDANYLYFDYVTLDMDKAYKDYMRRAKEVKSQYFFGEMIQDFLVELGDPNLDVNYPGQAQAFAYRIPTNDYPARNLFSNDLYIGGTFSDEIAAGECINIGPMLFKQVYRTTERKLYPLIVCMSYLRVSENIEQQSRQALSSLSVFPYEGFVLDLRCNRGIDAEFMQKLLPYFYEEGTHQLYAFRSTSSSDEETYTIEGNGMFANIPIAVLVNESTTGEASWFARVLKSRSNVAVVGRANAGPGCLSAVSEEYEGVSVEYPSTRIETFYNPLVPEIFVDWAGSNDEKDLLLFGGNYPDKIDYCLVAALDFIDSYN